MKVTLKKNVSRTGKFRDARGWFVITRDQIDKWVATFQEMLADKVVCPIVLDHKEEADKTVGKVTNLYRDGDYMVAMMEFPDQEKADLTTTNDVSIRASGVYHTGQKTYHDAIRHIALCPLPLVTGLGDYELCCSLKDMSNDEPTTNTETDMEKLLRFIANILGVELPADALTDPDKAIEWVKANFPVKTDVKASTPDNNDVEPKPANEVKACNDKAADVKACNNKDKTCCNDKDPDIKACNDKDKVCSEDDSELKACNDKDNDKQMSEEEIKCAVEAIKKINDVEASEEPEPEPEKDVKACNDTDDKSLSEKEIECGIKALKKLLKRQNLAKNQESDNDDPEAAKAEDEKSDPVDRVASIEKIKDDNDLADKSKDIACSINAARERELRSYLGTRGVTAERVGKWIDRFARSESLDVCCSLQDEYSSLIEGLGCRPKDTVLSPNPVVEDKPRDAEGPQMKKWMERMAKRKA